jgi:predicted Ser/Thr protein kinase
LAHSKPAYLKALGNRPLPATIEAGGANYVYTQTFKNDFFAITSLYEGEAGKVILKVQRQASFLLIPMHWAGRMLAARERHSLARLQGVPGIPRLIGMWSTTGLVREFIEGHTLADVARVDDEFHGRLRLLIDTIHQREMAYVDLEKPGNVLVGEDGKPYLFDFQIAWYWPGKWGGRLWPMRALLRKLQSGDRYHLIKLQRRSRPDQLTPEALRASYHKPWYVRLHSILTRPLTRLRRRILRRIDPQRGSGERGMVEQRKVSGA